MPDSPSLSKFIVGVLPDIDSYLAACHIPIKERAIKAALEFVRECVSYFQAPSGERKKIDFESADFVSDLWFAALYRDVEEWYRERYGEAFSQTDNATIVGFVLIWGTPFEIRIPGILVRPGKPGETIWISFPDSVSDAEDPNDWLISPPNLGHLSNREKSDLMLELREISDSLRSIRAKRLGVSDKEAVVSGLLDQVWHHIQQVAKIVCENRGGEVNPGVYWDIQMACECAYKALLQSKTGGFPEIHPLRRLHKLAAAEGLDVSKEIQDEIPASRDAINRRYGQRGEFSIEDVYGTYRAMLKIVRSALMLIPGIRLGRIELAKPPWFRNSPGEPPED